MMREVGLLAATSFREELNIERLVAASDERALFVARDLVLKRRVALLVVEVIRKP